MAIRITHGSAKDIGQLGAMAGAGQAAAEERERQNRLETAMISQGGANVRAGIAAQSAREMAEFQAFIATESEKRKLAFQVERDETLQRHKLELDLQERETFENKLMTQHLQRIEETETKINALDRAVERGELSPAQASELKLRIETDLYAKERIDPTQRMMAEILSGGGGEAPGRQMPAQAPVREGMQVFGAATPAGFRDKVAQPAAVGRELPAEGETLKGLRDPRVHLDINTLLGKMQTLDPESQAELTKIINTGSVLDIRKAAERLRKQKKPAPTRHRGIFPRSTYGF